MSSTSKRASDQRIESVCRVLERAGYRCARKVRMDSRLGYDREYIVDIVASDPNGRRILIKLRWQTTGGTTEAKIPFDVICLAHARAQTERAAKAYLALGGSGWSLKDYYLDVGLEMELRNADLVEIVSFEDLVDLADDGKL